MQLALIKKGARSHLDHGSELIEEIKQLREDLRLLRDTNHSLTQDNIRLTEYIRDMDRAASTKETSETNGNRKRPKTKRHQILLTLWVFVSSLLKPVK